MQAKVEPKVVEAKVVKIKTRGETRTISFDIPCTAKAGQYFEVGGGVDIVSGKERRPLYLASASAIGEERTKFNYKTANPKSNPTIDVLNALNIGDTIQLKGPCGNPLIPRGNTVLLIGAGTALTILRNMEKNFTAEGKRVEIIYSAKKRPDPMMPGWSDVAFPKKLMEYEKKDYNYITYTQENVHLAGEQVHYGRIDNCLATKELCKEATVFVCGPPEFENSVIAQLLGDPHHYDPSLIYISSWGNIAPINSSEDLKRRFHLEEKVNKEPSQVVQVGLFAGSSEKQVLRDSYDDRDDTNPKRKRFQN